MSKTSVESAALKRNARRRTASRGQNLVELAMTLPFVLITIFAIIEFGRVWFAFEGAKMAASEGAVVAAEYYNPAAGQKRMSDRLAAAGLNVVSATVNQVPNQHAYQANVTVKFDPFFGGVSLPSVSGSISIIPTSFNISYTAIQAVSVY